VEAILGFLVHLPGRERRDRQAFQTPHGKTWRGLIGATSAAVLTKSNGRFLAEAMIRAVLIDPIAFAPRQPGPELQDIELARISQEVTERF
jgi:hypothetical protein